MRWSTVILTTTALTQIWASQLDTVLIRYGYNAVSYRCSYTVGNFPTVGVGAHLYKKCRALALLVALASTKTKNRLSSTWWHAVCAWLGCPCPMHGPHWCWHLHSAFIRPNNVNMDAAASPKELSYCASHRQKQHSTAPPTAHRKNGLLELKRKGYSGFVQRCAD
jgi:hypothetical protein